MRGKEWNDEDLRILAQTNLEHRVAAAKVGRSIRSVRNKRHRMGVLLTTIGGRRVQDKTEWTKEMDDVLFEHVQSPEIASDQLGLPKSVIMERRKYLGFRKVWAAPARNQ